VISLRDGERVSNPQMLPGGKWILFLVFAGTATANQGQIVVQSRATGERRVLIKGVQDARYVPSGHIVYGLDNVLLAQAFDPERLTLSGGPVAVLDDVANVDTTSASPPPSMQFAVSSAGTMLYVPGSAAGATALSRLVLVVRDGTRSALAEITGMTWYPRSSPDGSRVAYGVSAGESLVDSSDLWVLHVARGTRTRVTSTGNNRFLPIWTRDGARLTFADGNGPTNRLLWALADGSGRGETLLGEGTRRFPTSWSPDGRTLAFYSGGSYTKSTGAIWMRHLDGAKRTTTPFVVTPFEERGAIFSPDGRWVAYVAYVSDKSGRNEIYALPYPGPGSEVTVSVGGGQEPV
jgi:Tol biopolymer transport system component